MHIPRNKCINGRARLLLLCMLAMTWLPALAQRPLLKPVHLTTDFRTGPRGVGQSPVFGWTLEATVRNARGLRQSEYRLRLATSKSDLRDAASALWDSGRVTSSTYWQQPYAGPPLQSATTYYWQIRSWTEGAAPGPWSEVAQFTTGLLRPEDWHAHWIAAEADGIPKTEEPGQLDANPPALPIFRSEVEVRKPIAGAVLFVSGLGQYEVHLNGRDVTDTVLNPGWTYYSKTVSYDSYDVTSLVHRGTNAVGVLLGNGMYNVQDVKGHYTKFSASFGQPKCLLQMQVRYVDGSSEVFVSDKSWQTHAGPITYSSTYGGESYDGAALPWNWDRVEYRADGWRPAVEVSGPGGRLSPEQASPLTVGETYAPVHITHPKPGITVYDLGKNMSGWAEIHVRGPAGASVRLLPGELLNVDGTVSQRSANAFPEDPVIFQYRLRGAQAGETWHPRFSYYSFRYVQVTATSPTDRQPEVLSLAGKFVHAVSPQVGEFSSSNPLFQRIHTLIDRAVLSNLASVVTDCPSREKLGWLEQTYLNASTLMLNYDVTGLYEKMGADIRDAQLPSGLVPSIAPEYVAFLDAYGNSNAFRDSPEWGSAVVLSPWALYQYTGDTRPLQQNYGTMQRYVAYLRDRSEGDLLNYGLGDWYDIGPKEPGPSQLTSQAVTASGVFYEDLVTLAKIADLLGHTDEATTYRKQAAVVGEAYNAKLFHPATNQYDRNSQTADAIPLALGLVPSAHVQGVLENLVADIHAHQDHVTAGDIGFHYLVRALTNYGRSDVLAAVLLRMDSPSYGYQLERGATTLTEAWDANPLSSQNHFMLGHGEEWFYRGLAGLSIDMSQREEGAVQLRPSFLGGISEARASFRSTRGLFALTWQHANGQLAVEITVPAGAVAKLVLPKQGTWEEAAVPAAQARGVVSHSEGADGLELTISSGSYLFSCAQVAGSGRKNADR